jgi:hypothetical protein
VRVPFEYAIIRIVPNADREEFVNAGVLLFCEAKGLLSATIELDDDRLLALCSNLDLGLLREHLTGFESVCQGGAEAGQLAEMSQRERWRWLTAPRSTILQTSPAHGGVAEDLDAVVKRILERMVRRPT